MPGEMAAACASMPAIAVALCWGCSLLLAAAKPIGEDVWDRGLVMEHIEYSSILREHADSFENTAHKHVAGSVLAFVTPWNSKGYDVAKTRAAKFTHVSPVWYQFRIMEASALVLTGGHDADDDWIKDVLHGSERGERVPKIIPRVVVELAPDNMTPFIMGIKDVVAALARESAAHDYDGWVLEVWPQWVAAGLVGNTHFHTAALRFLSVLASNVRAFNSRRTRRPLELHLVVPPIVPAVKGGPALSAGDWQALAGIADGVVVMTYDASHAGKPGPNAPAPWMRSNLEQLLPEEDERSRANAPKLMMGLNFYGNDYHGSQEGGAIVGPQYLEVLQKYRPKLQWLEASAEHGLEYVAAGERHTVWFPTLMSIQKRLELAHEYGVGMSIWELGQGLEYFMDLF